jgi:Meiotically Up-regulated Gene 113 (MUG113) protein
VIYFVKPRGRPFVKIGYARCVGARLMHLQTASPDELRVLAVVPGGPDKEMVVHARFAHLRVRGEWFHYTDEVRGFLRAEGRRYRPEIHDRPAHSRLDRRRRQSGRVVVWVQRSAGRRALMLQWHDPDTGKRKSKSAGTPDACLAESRRCDLETELNRVREAEGEEGESGSFSWRHGGRNKPDDAGADIPAAPPQPFGAEGG